jgi:broad specificity phosphatase PhoE
MPGWEDYTKDPFHFSFPGGESPQEVKKRVLAFKEKISGDNGWNSAVVVSHYTPIVFFILSAIGDGDERRAGFKIDNAALSVIEMTDSYEYIRMLNFVPWERY